MVYFSAAVRTVCQWPADLLTADPAYLIISSWFADSKHVKCRFPCHGNDVRPSSRSASASCVFVLFVPSQSVCKLCMHYPDYPLAPESPGFHNMEMRTTGLANSPSPPRRPVCVARPPASCHHAARQRTTPPWAGWRSPSCCCSAPWCPSLWFSRAWRSILKRYQSGGGSLIGPRRWDPFREKYDNVISACIHVCSSQQCARGNLQKPLQSKMVLNWWILRTHIFIPYHEVVSNIYFATQNHSTKIETLAQLPSCLINKLLNWIVICK